MGQLAGGLNWNALGPWSGATPLMTALSSGLSFGLMMDNRT